MIMDDAEMRRQLEQHHLASYGWALRCCGRDATQAEDVLQTAYLKILDGRARYDGHCAFKTWMFAVIRHTAADERRRQWLRTVKLAAYGRDYEGVFHEEPAATHLERMEMSARFRRALATLPGRQQEVLHLVFYQDFTIEKASKVMGVSVGSARTHYERGKRRLQKWFNEKEVINESELGRTSLPTIVS